MKKQLPSITSSRKIISLWNRIPNDYLLKNAPSTKDEHKGNLGFICRPWKSYIPIAGLKVVLTGCILMLSTLIAVAQQKVKDGTVATGNLPNKDAILELESSNKGLLHTKVALRLTTDAFPLSAHISGMILINPISGQTRQLS